MKLIFLNRFFHPDHSLHRVWTTRFGRANLVGWAVDYATFYLSAAWGG